MKTVKALMATAAIAMLAAQPVAAASSAQKLSIQNIGKSSVRAGAKSGKSKLLEGVPLFVIIGGVVVAVVTVVVVTDDSSSQG